MVLASWAWAQSAPAPEAAPSAQTAPVQQTNPEPADPAAAAPADEAAAREAEYQRQAAALYESLERRTGVIPIADGKVHLNVPETHYFIGAADARRIIVDVWGNPPSAAEGLTRQALDLAASDINNVRTLRPRSASRACPRRVARW